MDIWDSLRLSLRHWKFTLPVLLVGIAGAVILYASTPTVWTSDSTIVLVGPKQTERLVDGVVVREDENPFFEASVAMPLTRVLVYSFEDPERRAAVEAEGLSTDYEMEWDNRQPLITTRVTADTPEVADETALRLIELLADDLAARQEAIDAPPFERATVEVLAVSNPKEDFRTPRLFFGAALVVALGATVGAAFLVERILRRGEEPPVVEAPGVVPGPLVPGVQYVQATPVVRAVPNSEAEVPADEPPAAAGGSRWSR